MKVIVTGSYEQPIILETKDATGLIILSDDDTPNVLYRFLPGGKGWLRYTKGEDPQFDEVAKALNLR